MGKWWKGEPLTGVNKANRARDEAAASSAASYAAATAKIEAQALEMNRKKGESMAGSGRAAMRRNRGRIGLMSSETLSPGGGSLGAVGI